MVVNVVAAHAGSECGVVHPHVVDTITSSVAEALRSTTSGWSSPVRFHATATRWCGFPSSTA
jgi:hypothetical protein